MRVSGMAKCCLAERGGWADRIAASDGNHLIRRGQKGAAQQRDVAKVVTGADRDKARQVFIFCSQAVQHPRTKSWSDQALRAGVQPHLLREVAGSGGIHGVDEADVVDTATDMREQVADFDPALAVLAETPEGFEDLAGPAVISVCVGQWDRFVVVACEQWLA